MDVEKGSQVHGVDLDSETRCSHYHSALDILAIRMMCCGRRYACKDCHTALEDHEIQPWPRDRWDEPAVLCGACRLEMTITQYMASGNVCPGCGSGFNPGCRNHYHFYFEV
jgi:uncharacterized CHY-type Zn-finger protein